MRKTAVVFVALLLVATACSKKSDSSPSAEKSPAATPQTYEVDLGGKSDSFNAAITAFYPNDLTVHPGDTVSFKHPHFEGEPHTVTMGTLVDAAVGKLASLGATGTIAAQENSPELLKLPDVFPHAVTKLKGPPTPNQSAAQPCFLDSGEPAGDEAGPATTPAWLVGGAPKCAAPASQPDFTGKQTFYNLGLSNEEGATLSATFATSIAPGTYSLICLIHRGAMTAKITVEPAEKTVPSPAEQTARGKEQLAGVLAKLAPAEAAAAKATPEHALAGIPADGVFDAIVAEFAPKEVSIKAGDTVSWSEFSFHSFALNAPEDAIGAIVKAPDGSWAFNPKAGPPTKAPPPPVETLDFPPPDSAKPVVYDGGKYDGQGFYSTGIVGSLPPALVTFKLQFTKAGTYELRCQVHPDMKAKIKVA